jgi:nucleoside-diphosphate-sugar epimerase
VYVVGGQGYVGSRVVAFAEANGRAPIVVSRDGGARAGRRSLPWSDFLAHVADQPDAIVWLLDGAKHDELGRLTELLAVTRPGVYIAAVSSCTVYGNKHGLTCDEDASLEILTDNARLKAACEGLLNSSSLPSGMFRLGALYGPDDRGVRKDRVEKWVTEAAGSGTVTVPEPSHWRGWLFRDQAARCLYRAARNHIEGVFNVASSNHRFGEAAEFAAKPFAAKVQGDGKPDPMNYQVDASRARKAGLLDELEGEDIGAVVNAFVQASGELR